MDVRPGSQPGAQEPAALSFEEAACLPTAWLTAYRMLFVKSGARPAAELQRLFWFQLRVVGSAMGTRDELVDLASMCAATGVRPVIDRVLPLASARDGLAALAGGDVFGKVVLVP